MMYIKILIDTGNEVTILCDEEAPSMKGYNTVQVMGVNGKRTEGIEVPVSVLVWNRPQFRSRY